MGQLRGTGKILRQNEKKTKSREKERQKSPVIA